MAYTFYVSVTGAKQKKFKGESAKPHEGKIAGVEFKRSTFAPRDTHTGSATGKRQHQPITFLKEWDASTPQFSQALAQNEELSEVLFEFVRTRPTGEEVVYYTIKLTKAHITELKRSKPRYEHENAGANGSAFATTEWEKVSLTFQTIEEEHKLAKTMALDDWGAVG